MPGSDHRAALARSRHALLDAIRPAPDLTLVHGHGNVGDQLILAGARELLSGHVYRDVGVEELPSASGEVALIIGGGAWSHAYNDFMPELLAIAGMRFDRVIVLPSSFDVTVDRVAAALRLTAATVFAREAASHAAIAGLCRARLAHDLAFFVDYSAFTEPGSGTLNAFRGDGERAHDAPEPPGDNDDISATCAGLEEWLARISEHALVRTDRAHVMIAAALMGKEVEYASNSYFKLDALAQSWLVDFPVRRLHTVRPPAPSRAAEAPAPVDARVTAIVLSKNRPQHAERAIRSVLDSSVPARVLVIANGADAATRAALEAMAAGEPAVDVRVSDRDLGCAGGRQFGVELCDTELVLLLDDDAELAPGALEHLVSDLDAHAEAAAVTALVVYRNGTVHHFGGWVEVSDETARFEIHGEGLAADDPAIASTGPSGWSPGTGMLARAELLRAVPIDAGMAAYYEDNEWCLRVERECPGSFRRCREAVVHHELRRGAPYGSGFVTRARAARRLADHARFFRKHGIVLETELTNLVPELCRDDGSIDLPAARLLLSLAADRGPEWVLMEWINGAFAPLLAGATNLEARLAAREAHLWELGARAEQLDANAAEHASEVSALRERTRMLEERDALRERELVWLHDRHATLTRIEHGRWWRLRERVLPVLRAAEKLGRRGA